MENEPLAVRWENPSLNRYYEAHLIPDLFGDWVLMKVWGRKGAALGSIRQVVCHSYEQGIQWLNKLHKQRQQRGYQIIANKYFDE